MNIASRKSTVKILAKIHLNIPTLFHTLDIPLRKFLVSMCGNNKQR